MERAGRLLLRLSPRLPLVLALLLPAVATLLVVVLVIVVIVVLRRRLHRLLVVAVDLSGRRGEEAQHDGQGGLHRVVELLVGGEELDVPVEGGEGEGRSEVSGERGAR